MFCSRGETNIISSGMAPCWACLGRSEIRRVIDCWFAAVPCVAVPDSLLAQELKPD